MLQVGFFGITWSTTKPGITVGKGGSRLTRLIFQLLVSGSELTAVLSPELGEDFLKNVQPAGRASTIMSERINTKTVVDLNISVPSGSSEYYPYYTDKKCWTHIDLLRWRKNASRAQDKYNICNVV
jgi:hypothetical protein